MAVTQLKRYKIKPGLWDDFLSTWRDILVLRRKHGFGVLFALADRETNWFTWAIDHHGDFDAAAEGYYQDPDRVALDRIADYVSEWEIRKVDAMSIG
jgi:hypothetical protein